MRGSAYRLMVLSRSRAFFCVASGLVSMVKVEVSWSELTRKSHREKTLGVANS